MASNQMGKQTKGTGRAEAAIRSSVPPALSGKMPVLGIQHATSPLTAEQKARARSLHSQVRRAISR